MRVAIPHWHGRVSPVFDVATNLLLVDLEGEGKRRQAHVRLEADEPQARAWRLAETGTDVLICGAISWPLEMALVHAGIEVIPHTCGEVEHVLAAFLEGRLGQRPFLMPGCRGRRRRFHGGRQRSGSRG
ncbi:MAG: NifB/NifX family molybdenum-iron cluster-binding protein [bacterium]